MKLQIAKPWVEVEAALLDWSRKDWVGHRVKLDQTVMIVDRIEDRGNGYWRLYLISPALDDLK